jgi:hypothetical protein
MTIEEFIGHNPQYNPSAGSIYAMTNEGPQMLLDIRGFGRLQKHFTDETGKIDFKGAETFLDSVGAWVADAIEQKLQRESFKE